MYIYFIYICIYIIYKQHKENYQALSALRLMLLDLPATDILILVHHTEDGSTEAEPEHRRLSGIPSFLASYTAAFNFVELRLGNYWHSHNFWHWT